MYYSFSVSGAFQCTVMFNEFIEVGWFELSVRKLLPGGEIRSADLSRFDSDGEGDTLGFRVLEQGC